MTIKTLLKKLSSVEGVDESILTKIQTEADKLSAKNTELSQQVGSGNTKATALEATVADIKKAIGLDEATELSEVLGKVSAVVSERSQLESQKEALTKEKEALSLRATEAEGKTTKLERSSKMSEYAKVAGASEAVFKKLLGDRFDDLALDDKGELQLGGKPVKEAVAADPDLKLFEASLFSTTKDEPEKKKGTLPGGAPGGDNKEAPNPLAAYLEKTYLSA